MAASSAAIFTTKGYTVGLKTFVLKLTSAIAVDGVVLRAGELVELVESEAKALLARGKAVLATIEDDLGLGDKGDKGEKTVTVPADTANAADGDATDADADATAAAAAATAAKADDDAAAATSGKKAGK